MNAHNPFDANKDWSNPYCQNSSNDPMVDALLGNAYHVVRTVYCNLGNLKLLYDFLNQYGMVLGVQSEAELKALTTKAKYARIYGFSRAGDRQVTDYLYVEGDRTGIIPDDPEATGSWITVATSGSNGGGTSSGEGAYIPWVYSNGSATGGETTINVPDGTVGVPFIIVNGDMQYVGRGFEFNVDSLSVTLAQPLEEGDEVVFLLTGVPAVPDNPNVNDWVQINWLYNNGAAVGGEQVIAIPYTFQSIPAVYKNGLRLYKGLTTESYTADPDNQRILFTEPLATNDRLIVQIGGEAQILEASDHTLQEVARATNVKDSEVILSTDTTQFLNDKKIVYSVSEQKAYGLPALPSNIYINSVSNGQLTYSPGNITVDLVPVPNSGIALRADLASENLEQGDNLLTVKQPFTGSVVRTQHDKNAEIISVGDFYGADPTGIQDSLVAFNSAAATGAVVFVPKGDWLVSSNTDPATWLLDTGAYIRGLDDVGPTGTSINNTSRLSGKIIQYGGSALTALRIGASEPWLENNIRKFSESLAETVIKSSSGGIGALFASRSADNPSPNMQTIGSAHYGINDNIENPEPSWAAYLESVRYAGAGPAFGAEIDFVNLGNAYDFNPFSPIDAYSSSSAVTSSLWLSCGGGDSGLAANSNNISQAITLLPNAKKFNRGIVCAEGSIATGEVVAAPNGYRYSWYKDAITQGSLLSDSSSIRKVWADNAFSFDSHYRYKPTGFATTPGDVLHQYRAFGYDGANDVQGVTVTTQQKTAFSSGNARFSWVVAVSNDDGGITDVGLNVNGIAQFTPASSDNSIALGSAANRWSQVYSGSGTINTSDGRDKTPPLPIDDAVLDAWKDVEFIAFQWLSSIQQKGEDSARWHFGVIAQQVRDAFIRHGLDGTKYGILCYDEWDDQYQDVLDIDGVPTGEKKLVIKGGNRWGIRADQCLFLEAAYQRRRCNYIEERLSILEGK